MTASPENTMQRRSCRQSCCFALVFALCSAGGSGCVSSKGPELDSQNLADVAYGDDLPILDELAQGQSGIAKPLRIVIYDYPSLSQFPLLALKVDFSTQMVLLAAMGPASSRDCEIHVDRVWMGINRLEVDVTEFYPESDTQRTPAIASPIHAVVVQRCELPVAGFTSRIPKSIYLH